MSKRGCFLLVTRALAFIQVISALLEATYLPGRILSLQLYFRTQGTLANYRPSFVPDLMSALMLLIRIGILLLAALLLVRGGPKIQAWFFSDITSQENTEQ